MPGQPMPRPRARDLGVEIGLLPVGPTNSIADVPHVRVGHATVWRDEPLPPLGRGIARTGVTAIVPFEGTDLFAAPLAAGGAVLNGAGEVIGLTSINEWATLETPIFLTSSMAIGRVYDAAIWALIDGDPRMGSADALMPVVGECDDGYLNETRQPQIAGADVRASLEAALALAPAARGVAAVEEGVVGAGTGMVCHGLKGGIGTASRVVRPVARRGHGDPDMPPGDDAYTLGVLALTNYGLLERLTIAGIPVGRTLHEEGWRDAGARAFARADAARATNRGAGGRPGDGDAGSCIVVVATDAPMTGHQLERLARRAGLGLARTGSVAGHGSGEIFVAFSTGLRYERDAPRALRREVVIDDRYLGAFFGAAVEATEEAAIDSLFVADTVVGRDGNVAPGLPVERTLELLGGACGPRR